MHVSLQYSVFIILLNEVLNSFLYINESEYTKYSYMWTAEEIWNSDIFVDITVAAYVDISVIIITDVNFWHKFYFSHTDLDSSLEKQYGTGPHVNRKVSLWRVLEYLNDYFFVLLTNS